ncbi:MAG: heavy-metal-associated domain-containing protein [Prevotella sp.]|nr:heavy-metal-associated domain-containing protein [Prevotella sp.]
MKKSIITLMLVMAAMVASAKDIKTVIFTTTPQMHCANCETKIKSNLRFEKGVKDIKTDVDEQKVYVTYDAQKTTEDKLQKSFEKFGYKAEKTTKDAKVEIHEGEDCENM